MTVKKTAIRKPTGRASQIIIKPLVTEKATNLSSQNKYVFAIAPDANKITVAQAITELYKVKPVAVNIINLQGKRVRYGRIRGKQKNWKKAVVTLRQGESIKVYDV